MHCWLSEVEAGGDGFPALLEAVGMAAMTKRKGRKSGDEFENKAAMNKA